MYTLLIRLMLIAALAQFGISLKVALTCNSRDCSSRIEKASRAVLHVEWKPVSVFPEDAKRFR